MKQPSENRPEQFGFPMQEEEEFNLRDYVQVLRRRRLWVAVCFATVLFCVGAWTLVSKPVYRAEAVLEIQRSSSQSLSLESLFEEQLGPGVEKEVLTEVEILKSRPVAERAVELTGFQVSLDTGTRLYSRLLGKVQALVKPADRTPEAVMEEPARPLYAEALRVPALSAPLEFDILFSKEGVFGVLTREGEDLGAGIIGEPCDTGILSFALRGKAPPAGDRLRVCVSPRPDSVKFVQTNLQVSPIRNTRLIRLQIESAAPHEAERLLSGVVSAYRQIKVDQKTAVASGALDFISEHLDVVEKQLQEAVGEFKTYKEENKLVNLDQNVEIAINRLAQLEGSRKEVEMLRGQAGILLAGLERQGAAVDQASLYALGNALDQPVLVSLASNLSASQAERAAMRSQYKEEHPLIQSLDKQIQTLKRKIRADVAAVVTSLDERGKTLSREIEETEALLGELPEAEQRLAELTRNARVYQDTYDFMLQKKGEIQVTRAGMIGDVWVVEPAYGGPGFVKPRLRINLALGIVLGLMLGVMMAFFLEHMDDSVKNSEDVQALADYPVLGNIGHFTGSENGSQNGRFLSVLDQPLSQLSEAFRTFRSNLLFTGMDGGAHRMMLFSSPLPGEGKSSCAANLAAAISQTGRKVLLVDTDLRKPVQHRIFRSSRSPGLVNALVAKDWEKALSEAIQPTEVEGLDVLVCGDQPPNPNEMLGSVKMGRVLDWLRERYDYTLFDSPPVIPFSDALVLGQRLDGVLCVVRAGQTGKSALKKAMETFGQARLPVVGLVVNDIDFKQERYYYGQYYKYYQSYYNEKNPKQPLGETRNTKHE